MGWAILQNFGCKFLETKFISFKTILPMSKKADSKAPALCAENKIFLTFLIGSFFVTGSLGNTSVATNISPFFTRLIKSLKFTTALL